MRIETQRLVIRSFTPADAEGMLGVFDDPEVRKFLPPFPDPTLESIGKSVARRIAMEQDHGHGLWAVERRDTGELIGDCGLMQVEGTGPEVEIAYHYKQTAWNNGYGTEAALACRSWRVMEKAGMRYEGTASYYGLTGLKKYVADRATWSAPR
jgi:RimJ/RimL family protein N-acetyltransferase